MAHSLFFIPDISGYTNFIQTTEIEHSQHVIAELLEVLIEANVENLKLAEIEGDALFFYKENKVPSQERLLAQIERMFKAFYSHLKLLETNRICPCNACATAPDLNLKIIVHCGEMQFIEVQGTKKPFGKSVIQSHRLLKNSIESDNYVLVSQELSEKIWLSADYKSKLYDFKAGADTYDNEEIPYNYTIVNVEALSLKKQEQLKEVTFGRSPDILFEQILETSKEQAYEYISNYRYRNDWTTGVDDFQFKLNEVTRLDSEHTCVINGKHIDFIAVTKEGKPGQLVYGEMTKTPPLVDALYQFYLLEDIGQNRSKLTVEVFLEAKSLIKKILVQLIGKRIFKKGVTTSLQSLSAFIKKQ
ncbi:DUF2652 domain-containing protein [Flavobacteriaceae bacterium S356]|uniref:DUF2652 domain-containing protein n=1 Tax=Asprobacillus argus TaxID=3076534 RepID=A0ABU3LCR3_9FLAO|nr:DUF2652 domain-containing protein [Flavobacteriaceae bacterium S356]